MNEYNESLYTILLSKFDDFLIQDEESDAETEEIDLDDIDEIRRNIYIINKDFCIKIIEKQIKMTINYLYFYCVYSNDGIKCFF